MATCDAILKSGKRKGRRCGRTVKAHGRCGYHSLSAEEIAALVARIRRTTPSILPAPNLSIPFTPSKAPTLVLRPSIPQYPPPRLSIPLAPSVLPPPTLSPTVERDDEETEDVDEIPKKQDEDIVIDGQTYVDHGASRKRFVERIQFGNKEYVCNVTGSSADRANWKKFYTKYSEIDYPKTCRAKDCERLTRATGHMYRRDHRAKSGDKIIYNYLVPICNVHNGPDYDSDKPVVRYFLLKKDTVAVKIIENPLTREHRGRMKARL